MSPDGRLYWDGQGWKPVGGSSVPSANRAAGLTVIAGGALMLIGIFLPWLSATLPFVGTITRSLMDGGGDGWVLLGLAGLVIVLGLAMAIRDPQKWAAALAVLPLAIGMAVVVIDYNDVSGRVQNLAAGSVPVLASVGPGPYMSGFGVLIAAIGTCIALFSKSVTQVVDTSHLQVQPSQPSDELPPSETATSLGASSADGKWFWNGERWLPNS
jgi:hypothetical protein